MAKFLHSSDNMLANMQDHLRMIYDKFLENTLLNIICTTDRLRN